MNGNPLPLGKLFQGPTYRVEHRNDTSSKRKGELAWRPELGSLKAPVGQRPTGAHATTDWFLPNGSQLTGASFNLFLLNRAANGCNAMLLEPTKAELPPLGFLVLLLFSERNGILTTHGIER